MKAFFLVPLLFILVTANDFQATPPMGWSSWNTFFSQIDEEKVMGIADALKRLKLDKLGYVYLTIDDFWNLPQRDSVTGQMLVRKENVTDLSFCQVSVIGMFKSVVTPLIWLLEHEFIARKIMASV